jgi:protein TonB
MFADTFVDSAWANTSRRGWTALASFTFQAFLIGIVLVLPLIYTQGLPQLEMLAGPTLLEPTVGPPPPPPRTHATHAPESNMSVTGMVAPQSVPKEIASINETTAPPPIDVTDIGVAGGVGDPRVRGVLGGLGNPAGTVLPPPPPKPVSRPVTRTSFIMQGYLVHRVQPSYPPLARAARIQGAVELHAVIGRDGGIENLRVVSGHPMLVAAAVEAVRQWRYRPYILNGEPVEVETQITVNFVLSGS